MFKYTSSYRLQHQVDCRRGRCRWGRRYDD